jgi:hypothetical protein
MTDTARENAERARRRQHEVTADDAAIVSAVDAVARLRHRQLDRSHHATFRCTVDQFDLLLEANHQLAEVLTAATPLLPRD